MAEVKMAVGRGVLVVFCAVFAILFTAVGYLAGLRPLASTLQAALSVQSWQPVPAQVLDAQIRKHAGSEGGTTYQVLVRYRYEVAGKSYESQRVGLNPQAGADNVGDWQERWFQTLHQAQQQGRPITVWVNPAQPSEALVDPSIRWRLQIFRLPFALVFTGVGLAAGWMLWRLLSGRDAKAPEDSPPNPLTNSHWGLWAFTLFWCGISFPMAALFWSDARAPWWVKALLGGFVAIGAGMVWAAVHQTRKVWRYRGLVMTALPSRPRAGQPVEVTLVLPPRAAQHPAADQFQLRVAQYRVDEASSGSPERRVQTLEAGTRRLALGDGHLRLVARFSLPDDAPTHGAQRSGERVDWRLELLGAEGGLELAYDLPIQASTAIGARLDVDPYAPSAAWQEEIPIGAIGEAEEGGAASPGASRLPVNVQVREGAGGWSLQFGQTPWRWSAVVAAAALVGDGWIHARLQPGAFVLPQSLWGMLAWLVLLGWLLHAATRRWTLSVLDDGLLVARGSWFWSRRVQLPGAASQSLVYKLFFTNGAGAAKRDYYAVHAKNAQGELTRLTPGVHDTGTARAVGQAIAQAWKDRQGRFTPGLQRAVATEHSRPAWGGLLVAALACAWVMDARVLAWNPARHQQAARAPQVERIWAPADAQLIDAQNAGNAQALAQALQQGANPNLLADSGSSMLMLAAHRGQQEHVELLLQAGAQVDFRQTQKDSERGDTALLRAFYGGHLGVAQRLVQAGASLQARNRWDWGPVHMAAQSGCVPCLAWLQGQGQSLVEPAPASRGETPAMLAAAKGRLAALEWLQAQGVDLWSRDAHGKTALDWAQFGKQADAVRWLQERQPVAP